MLYANHAEHAGTRYSSLVAAASCFGMALVVGEAAHMFEVNMVKEIVLVDLRG